MCILLFLWKWVLHLFTTIPQEITHTRRYALRKMERLLPIANTFAIAYIYLRKLFPWKGVYTCICIQTCC